MLPTWNPKQPFINGCFNWMIPNLYIGNDKWLFHQTSILNWLFGVPGSSWCPTFNWLTGRLKDWRIDGSLVVFCGKCFQAGTGFNNVDLSAAKAVFHWVPFKGNGWKYVRGACFYKVRPFPNEKLISVFLRDGSWGEECHGMQLPCVLTSDEELEAWMVRVTNVGAIIFWAMRYSSDAVAHLVFTLILLLGWNRSICILDADIIQ